MSIIQDEVIVKALQDVYEDFEVVVDMSIAISKYMTSKEAEFRMKLGKDGDDVKIQTLVCTEYHIVIQLIQQFKDDAEKDLKEGDFSISSLRTSQYLDSLNEELSLSSKIKSNVDDTCPKCGEKNAFSWGVQTRSADEAETIFVICLSCHMKWRGS